ncbi:BrnT family toxin [Rhodanobacter sp. DHB23]|uniref:BrnT family toxin n=1 Tax=Rhodanobacter sp. DHB23 TaxID=2775923 RepID=UPI00177E3907|nr:BrnT family toxin [Rhodanobacter sp. DHB23]MBD8872560.1 BrnT family toxin [Rhodanobacter sp. DHB23]
MEVSYDPVKNERNIVERGLSFEQAAQFNFETALFIEDTRRDYGETRWQALGFLDGRLHMLVFAETGASIRVISFRKANKREVRRYEQATRS